MKVLRNFKDDLKLGLETELEVIDYLKINWEEEANIRNTKDIYNDDYYIYDFESEGGTTWENKTRRLRKNQYPTTLLPVAKVRDGVNTKQYFTFNFTAAFCCIEYNKELFDTFVISDITTYRYGKVDIPKPHYLIPVNLLTDLLKVYRKDFPESPKIEETPMYPRHFL